MSKGTWVETLACAQGIFGPNVAASATTYFSLLPSHAYYVFPAGYFDTPGKTLRIRAQGVITGTGSSATNDITFIANLGSVNVFSSGALLCVNTASHTNCPWDLQLLLTCKTVPNSTVNAATTFMGIGRLLAANVMFNVNTNVFPQLAASLIPGLPVDTTSNTQFDFGCAWTAATAHSIQLINYTLEALN